VRRDWRPPKGAGEEAWSLGKIFMHLAIDEHHSQIDAVMTQVSR
jgi:hypothetical protein